MILVSEFHCMNFESIKLLNQMKYSLMMVVMSDFVYDRLCGVQRFAFVDPETDNTVLDQKPAMRKKY